MTDAVATRLGSSELIKEPRFREAYVRLLMRSLREHERQNGKLPGPSDEWGEYMMEAYQRLHPRPETLSLRTCCLGAEVRLERA